MRPIRGGMDNRRREEDTTDDTEIAAVSGLVGCGLNDVVRTGLAEYTTVV